LGSIGEILLVGKIANFRAAFDNPGAAPTGGDVDGGRPPLEDSDVIDR